MFYTVVPRTDILLKINRAMFERDSPNQTDFDLVFGLSDKIAGPVEVADLTIDFTGTLLIPRPHRWKRISMVFYWMDRGTIVNKCCPRYRVDIR
jgi:hypothetical protein